jgi:hypothetical protein
MGPYQVVEHMKERAHKLKELDGTNQKTPVAEFRLIPYLKQEHLEKWK